MTVLFFTFVLIFFPILFCSLYRVQPVPAVFGIGFLLEGEVGEEEGEAQE